MIKVLGISASPIEDSNTGILLTEALGSIEFDDVESEIISLRDLEIKDCCQCDWCCEHQTKEAPWRCLNWRESSSADFSSVGDSLPGCGAPYPAMSKPDRAPVRESEREKE